MQKAIRRWPVNGTCILCMTMKIFVLGRLCLDKSEVVPLGQSQVCQLSSGLDRTRTRLSSLWALHSLLFPVFWGIPLSSVEWRQLQLRLVRSLVHTHQNTHPTQQAYRLSVRSIFFSFAKTTVQHFQLLAGSTLPRYAIKLVNAPITSSRFYVRSANMVDMDPYFHPNLPGITFLALGWNISQPAMRASLHLLARSFEGLK